MAWRWRISSALRGCVDAGRGVLVSGVTASTLVADVKLRADGCEQDALVFAGRRLDDGHTVSLHSWTAACSLWATTS